jgi:hypothetical protein
VLLLVGDELHVPLLVRGRLPVLVGARLLRLLQHADIGLLLVVLSLPLLLMLPVLLLMVTLRLHAVMLRRMVGD